MHLYRIYARALTAAVLFTITATAWKWWPDPTVNPRTAVVEQPVHIPAADQFPGIAPADCTSSAPVTVTGSGSTRAAPPRSSDSSMPANPNTMATPPAVPSPIAPTCSQRR